MIRMFTVIINGILTLFLSGDLLAINIIHPQQPIQFISVADIHFNPYFDCSKASKSCEIFNKLNQSDYTGWRKILEENSAQYNSSYFEDTNYALLKNTLSELELIKKNEKPRFVLILGDFLAHDFRKQFFYYSSDKSNQAYANFVRKTLQFLTVEFNKVFPDIDIYPAVGNNDSYTGNYKTNPNGGFFRETTNTWAPYIKNKTNQASFQNTFPLAGYYTITIPGLNHKIIMLNTVLFSSYSRGSAVAKAAQEELKWLQNQLEFAAAHNQKVILAYHIPIGVDVYGTLKNKFTAVHDYWQAIYTSKFEDELKKYNAVVVAILAAHIHFESLQLIAYNKLADIPVVITPSISPNYGNNPGFKIFTYNPESLQFDKIESYVYLLNKNPSTWKN